MNQNSKQKSDAQKQRARTRNQRYYNGLRDLRDGFKEKVSGEVERRVGRRMEHLRKQHMHGTYDRGYRKGYLDGSATIPHHLYSGAACSEVFMIGVLLDKRNRRTLTPEEKQTRDEALKPALAKMESLGLLHLADDKDHSELPDDFGPDFESKGVSYE
jgi:hypothetical protein